MLLAKSVNGEELAREIISILSTQLQIQHHLLVTLMRYRASVNNVAMQIVHVLYPKVFDIGFFSHTIDHVGEKFNTPELIESLFLPGFPFFHAVRKTSWSGNRKRIVLYVPTQTQGGGLAGR